MLVLELRMALTRPRKRMEMTGGNSKFTQRGADMTNSERAPDYTRRFWAKSEPRDGYPKRIHLLEHHLADVGACFEALLAQPTIRQRLARSGGLDTLDDTTAARLTLLAAMHDIGKVNIGFQSRVWEPQYLQGSPRISHAGHTLDLTPVLSGKDDATAKWFFDALGWWWDAIESWDDRNGETVCALFVAALSHHGLPLQLEGERHANPGIWRSFRGLDPAEGVRRIGRLAREWFPAALGPGAPHLPYAPEFQHMFLGLCTLADWIGSNESWFEFVEEPDDDYMAAARRKAKDAIKEIGLDLSGQRAAMPGQLPGFAQLFGFDPNAIQQASVDTPPGERLVIIESETGSGKTEAALWRFAHMYERGLVDGLYFALPTRAAATQLHGRVSRFVEGMFPAGNPPEIVLAVPSYVRAEDITHRHLQDYDVWWNHHPADTTRERSWASERPKRFLAAQIAVGTVDQAMMAALKVKHAHMRAACLSRNLLVVDEVHASDTYMRRVLKSLLDAHLGAGGYALLMSATLGSAARQEWLSAGRPRVGDLIPLEQAKCAPYPAVSVMAHDGERIAPVGMNDREKRVNISAKPVMHDFDGVAGLAMGAARAGAKVLVIRNTVNYAIDTQQAVEGAASFNMGGSDRSLLFAWRDIPTLHHGRFAADDRKLLDGRVEVMLGKGREAGGMVVVGTQTLEQSLDIDADLLITDLCPVDVLLQRIGRLHRHPRDDRPAGYATPACVVLTPEGDDLSPLLKPGPNRNGLGPHGYVYKDLRILEATRRLIDEYPQWTIPGMNRELVERATHPEALEAIARELGEDWQVHAINIEGEILADFQTAGGVVIRRDKSFFGDDNRDVLFGSVEEHIRTRLGDEGIDVELAPPPPSPFEPGRTISRMSLPARGMESVPIDGPVEPVMGDGGFTFSIGDRTFRYDRRGLRRV